MLKDVEKLIFWSVDQKMLKYTPVALVSRQFEDTPWLYRCVRPAHKRALTSSLEIHVRSFVDLLFKDRLPPSHRASPMHAFSHSSSLSPESSLARVNSRDDCNELLLSLEFAFWTLHHCTRPLLGPASVSSSKRGYTSPSSSFHCTITRLANLMHILL